MKHDQITIDTGSIARPQQAGRASSVGFDRFAPGGLLADAWERLERHAALPTQGLGFIAALSRSLLADTPITVFTGRGAGGLQGLIPLCRSAGAWSRWRLAGVCEVFEPGDALCDGPEGARLLAQVLARESRPVTLDRIPADSPMIAALRQAMRGRALVSVRPAAGSPFITLGPQWHRPEDCFNAGRRSDFRRAARRAAALGPVFHEVIAPDRHDFDTLFDEAIAVELRSWKGESGSAMARQPGKEALFRDWLRHAAGRGTLRIAFLRIGQRAVAMQMGMVHTNRFWLLKIGYDAAYGACSPGSLLMLHMLGHCAREGLEACELLGAMEPWITHMWTQEQHDCVRLRSYPYNLRGAVALAADGAVWLRERLARRAR